eukprot:3166190-Pyramimonas_sp.AAC.2
MGTMAHCGHSVIVASRRTSGGRQHGLGLLRHKKTRVHAPHQRGTLQTKGKQTRRARLITFLPRSQSGAQSDTDKTSVEKYNEALKQYAKAPFEYNHDAGLCNAPTLH